MIGITHKPYPNKLFQLTKRKSDQLLFIPREHCPETLVLDKNDFSVFGEKDQSRLEIEKRLMKKRLLIGKTDTGFQGRGTSLITTEEFLEDSKSLSKALQ